jgi:tetraprenyl-beta-curcumene synthase
VPGVGDRWFAARASAALGVAQIRYWSTVAPLVRRELRHWQQCASEIVDPALRRLAVAKLRHERFNSEVAAMIATSTQADHREAAVRAIVALQVMYDYLDALVEQPTADPLRDGLSYFKAFNDAVTLSATPTGDYYSHNPGSGDGGYLTDLASTVHESLLRLPATAAVAETILISTARCANAQVRVHAASSSGLGELEDWATLQAQGTGLQWREWLFGAMGSVVATHALIAAAATEGTTSQQARELDSTYLSLSVLTTALDHLVDHERDNLTGAESYLSLYESREVFARQTAAVAASVLRHTRTLPNSAHHAMILAGVVAYYTSQPSAMGNFARPATELIRQELRPLITPTLATMHLWRMAKRAQQRHLLTSP